MGRDMELINQPEKWQCPYCLKAVGVFGNFVAKVFGTRFHGCDFSNVAKPEPPKPPIDWEEVINKYITCIKINQAVLEEQAAQAPSTHKLEVVKYPRGLALVQPDEVSPVFLDHISYVDLDSHSHIEFVINSLEHKKEYSKTLRPSFAGIKLDPNITRTTKLGAEWQQYILPDVVALRWHTAGGRTIYSHYPKHVADRMLEAACELLRTGKSQIVEYKPEDRVNDSTANNQCYEPSDDELSDGTGT